MRFPASFRPGRRQLWLVPVSILIATWAIAPSVINAPDYKLPRFSEVARAFWTLSIDGTFLHAIASSLARLAVAFILGAAAGIILGVLVATSRVTRDFLEPVIAFFQAVAGIAWIPMAIVWFGFGTGPALFVVGNAVFFIVLYNTLQGVEGIRPAMYHTLSTLGASKISILREVVVPGALVNVLVGLRSGLAFGWRALIAVEIIAANTGLGYVALNASRNYQGDVVIATIIVVGILWLLMDRLFLSPLQKYTVGRWGLLSEDGL